MKPRVKLGLKVDPPTDYQTGIMSAADQILHFKGWHYMVQLNIFLGPKLEGYRRLMLPPEVFDAYLGGFRFYVGMGRNSEAEFTTSASHAFTHTRVIDGFPKLVAPEEIVLA